jgi:hypothetical protein
MKLKICGYEVEIKAKEYSDNFNKLDTESFLNELSIHLATAANRLEEDGLYGMATRAQQMADDIYNELKANGLYSK